MSENTCSIVEEGLSDGEAQHGMLLISEFFHSTDPSLHQPNTTRCTHVKDEDGVLYGGGFTPGENIVHGTQALHRGGSFDVRRIGTQFGATGGPSPAGSDTFLRDALPQALGVEDSSDLDGLVVAGHVFTKSMPGVRSLPTSEVGLQRYQ